MGLRGSGGYPVGRPGFGLGNAGSALSGSKRLGFGGGLRGGGRGGEFSGNVQVKPESLGLSSLITTSSRVKRINLDGALNPGPVLGPRGNGKVLALLLLSSDAQTDRLPYFGTKLSIIINQIHIEDEAVLF